MSLFKRLQVTITVAAIKRHFGFVCLFVFSFRYKEFRKFLHCCRLSWGAERKHGGLALHVLPEDNWAREKDLHVHFLMDVHFMVVKKILSQCRLDIYFSQSKCLSEVLSPREAPGSKMLEQQFRLRCTNIFMGTLSFYFFHNVLNINVETYWYSQIPTQYFAETLEVPNFCI